MVETIRVSEDKRSRIEHKKLEASSVGKVNQYYFDRENDRVKGFFFEPITSSAELEIKIDDLENQLKGVSRATARYFVDKSLINSNLRNVEAVIPLQGNFRELALLYLGKNIESRHEPGNIIEEEIVSAVNVDKTISTMSYDEKISKTRESFELKLETDFSESDLEVLAKLYNSRFKGSYTFALTAENIKELVGKQSNIKAIVRDRNKIVSIGVAEFCKHQLGGIEFKFAELSDAATDENYKERGLYTATSALLIKELYRMNTDLIYGEARAAHIAVNVACRKSGRRLYGLLHKHCIINGDKDIDETGPYENLNVWAICNESLDDILRGGNGN